MKTNYKGIIAIIIGTALIATGGIIAILKQDNTPKVDTDVVTETTEMITPTYAPSVEPTKEPEEIVVTTDVPTTTDDVETETQTEDAVTTTEESITTDAPVTTEEMVVVIPDKEVIKEDDGTTSIIIDDVKVPVTEKADGTVVVIPEKVPVSVQDKIEAVITRVPVTVVPTKAPTGAKDPVQDPTTIPSNTPTENPVTNTVAPTKTPVNTNTPTTAPTKAPVNTATNTPTKAPTKAPTQAPVKTATPTPKPTSTVKPAATNTPAPTSTPVPVTPKGYCLEDDEIVFGDGATLKAYFGNTLTDKMFQDALVKEINKYRVSHGLKALEVNKYYQGSANIRSKELVKRFEHTRPNGESFGTAMDDYAMSVDGNLNVSMHYVAQEIITRVSNIGTVYDVYGDKVFTTKAEMAQAIVDVYAKNAVIAWSNSKGHNEIMLRADAIYIGAAIGIDWDNAMEMRAVAEIGYYTEGAVYN